MTSIPDMVGWIATVSSAIQFWAIADPVREVRRIKSTVGKRPYSLYGMIFGTLWWTVYGLKANQWAVVACDSIGLGFAIWGITAFLQYPATEEEGSRTRSIVLFIAIASVVALGFALLVLDYDNCIFMIGMVASVGTVATVSGPLAALKEMIDNRDVHLLVPRIMAICAVTSALWTLYSILYNDMYQFPPNFIGFLFVMLQVGVYLKYRQFLPAINAALEAAKAEAAQQQQHPQVVVGGESTAAVAPATVDGPTTQPTPPPTTVDPNGKA